MRGGGTVGFKYTQNLPWLKYWEMWFLKSVSSKGRTQLDLIRISISNSILLLPLLEFSSSKNEVSDIALSISKKEMTGGANKKAEKIKIKM